MAVTNSWTWRRRAAMAALGVAVSGCPTPGQEGGLARVEMAGVARRLEMMCGTGHRDPSCISSRDASSDEIDGESAVDVDRDGDHDGERDPDHAHDD